MTNSSNPTFHLHVCRNHELYIAESCVFQCAQKNLDNLEYFVCHHDEQILLKKLNFSKVHGMRKINYEAMSVYYLDRKVQSSSE